MNKAELFAKVDSTWLSAKRKQELKTAVEEYSSALIATKPFVMCRFSSQILNKMIEKLKELGFIIGTLQDVTGSGLNTKEKIIYKLIPHYEKSFVYAYVNDLDTFFFGDSRDSEFFTLSVSSIEQIGDLFKSLDYEKYL